MLRETRIIGCPYCDQKYRYSKLLSFYNNGDSIKFYSDGSSRGFPTNYGLSFITKCDNCDNFFYLKDGTGQYISNGKEDLPIPRKLKENDILELLESKKYYEEDEIRIIFYLGYRFERIIELLNTNKYPLQEEKKIRFNIWHAFNDRELDGKEKFLSKNEENIYIENIEKLIDIFLKNDDGYLHDLSSKKFLRIPIGNKLKNENLGELSIVKYKKDDTKLLLGDMYRNIGNFENAIKVYQLVTDIELIYYRDILIAESYLKNKKTVML